MPETGPKRKLLDAAERLILEKGFDSISVRDITGAVKANVAAVNYHFGSREGLLDMVMFHAIEPLCEERTKLLEQAERQRAGKMVSVEDALGIYVSSLISTAAKIKADQFKYLPLVGKSLLQPEARLSPIVSMLKVGISEKFLAALARACPSIPETDLASRWYFFDAGLNQSLQTLSPNQDLEEILSSWVNFGIRGFSGKPPKNPAKDDPQGQLFDF
ncbi:TetR/AcrR family transcriptional regulator [Luteolibacter sp. AS25]|uniref:TetR/AcrR family transcriptional regulator n=1 Tax=Luteolibacter sp. AS25 TaxID=3135776 RepID=UPI00398ACDBB